MGPLYRVLAGLPLAQCFSIFFKKVKTPQKLPNGAQCSYMTLYSEKTGGRGSGWPPGRVAMVYVRIFQA